MRAKAIERPPRLSALPSLTPYVIAVASTAVAAGMTRALWPANQGVIFAFYYLAVIVSATYGYERAGWVALALSILSTNYSFVEPYGAWSFTLQGACSLFLFSVVAGVMILVVERLKTNEHKLRESEDLFRKAFHSNPVGIAISRASDGRYVEMNDTFGALIGRSRQETIGRTAIELGLVSAEEREQYITELSRKGSFRDRPFVIPHQGREASQVLVSSEQIKLRGEPHFLGIFNDITERTRADDALRRIEIQFRHVMDVLPVGAYTCDADGRITYFNDFAARLWGREPRLHDMTERFCGSVALLDADDTAVSREQCWMARTLATGQSYSGEEITIERPDHTRVTVLAHVHPLPDLAGGRPGAINVLVDITDRKRDQETLREQAELFDNAQRIGRMGSWNLDLRTGRLAWPDATCRLFGIAPSEFAGTFEQFHSFILPEDVAVYDAANGRLSPSEPVFEAEYRIRRPDGVVRWMHSRGQLDVDATGEPIGRTGIVMDMTDQHAAGVRVAETVTQLRIAGKVAHLGGWTIQLPSRQFTWSDETCAIHDLPSGYKPTLDEGIGYYPAEYRADVLQHVETCERDGTSYDFEVPKITATGRRIWVRSIGEAVRDADGRIVGLQGAFQDVSTLRQAEEALRDSEAEFRALAESMPQMVWMTRPDGWNTYFNQRWVDYTGLSLEESYGHGWNTPFHPDDRQRAWDAWQQAIAGGDYNVESRLRGADGRYRWMLVRGLPLRDDTGLIVKWIGTCTDIDDLKQAQEAALRSESVQRALAAELETERARLVAAQAVASIGSWESEFSTGALTWSTEFQRILGVSTEQLLVPDGFLQHVHPEDRPAVTDAFTRSLAQHLPGAVEYRLVMPDGRIKVIEGHWQIGRNEKGEPVRAIGTCQDITERRQAQEAIRMQVHMLDQIGQAVMATDPEGRVTYANRFANELYGFDAGEMVGQNITDTVEQSSQRHDEIIAHVKRGETWSGESLVHARRGRVFPAYGTVSPVLNEGGHLIAIVGVSTDITARKGAEDEARQKDTLIRMAGRLTHTGGWAIDVPGEHVFWSDELFDILDYARGDLPPLAELLALYPDPWREKVVSAIQACRQEGTPFDLETEILTAKGARKWVRLSAEAERRADGSITRVQGAFQDLTEHKHLEQQYLRAQRMESIGTLAGGIAHDLNNVLAPILLSIGLLQQDEHDAERLETLVTIEASAKRGAAMIGRLLSFARGADRRPEDVQVPPLVRDLATIVRDTFPKNITFVAHLSPDLWALQADATQLHQVLLNLCVNARDAMLAGGQITLTAKNIVIDEAYAALNIDARSGPYVAIAVEDTGTGISKEIIDKIFDPFFTTKDIGKGTGLGLATSLAIVTGHKGFLRVSSEPGTGTRFDVYLPAQTTRAKRASPVPAVVHPRGQGETVLVVDDEPGIRLIAQRTLTAFGYRVLLASDGAEAVALYVQHQAEIAVVLTDMMMPMMDGTATIQELVRLNPQVRIIGASGLATDANAAGAAAARVKYFLSKPYTAETLLTAMRAALAEAPTS